MFYHLEVRWTEAVPSARDCEDLASLLVDLDSDAGTLSVSHQGIAGLWRHPTLDLPDALSLCHAFGFACEGRRRGCRSEESEEETLAALAGQPWVPSSPDLAWVTRDPSMFFTVRDFSRRFARYLPPAPPQERTELQRSRGQRRRSRARRAA
jgi:hypothetical protein